MKKIALLVVLMLTPVAAKATEFAHVVQIQPKYNVTSERQCHVETVAVQTNDNSTAGSLVGAIAGGILGNQVGKGTGKTLAAVAGAVVGSQVGNNLSDKGGVRYVDRTVCTVVPTQYRTGDIVTFEYRGKTFSQEFDY